MTPPSRPTPPHPDNPDPLTRRWITSDVGPDALENWSVFYDNWFTGESGDKARTTSPLLLPDCLTRATPS